MAAIGGPIRDWRTRLSYKLTMAFPTGVENIVPSALTPVTIQPSGPESFLSRACPRSDSLPLWHPKSGSRVRRRRTYPPHKSKHTLRSLRPGLQPLSGEAWYFHPPEASTSSFDCPTSMACSIDLGSGNMSMGQSFENCCCATFGQESCPYCTATLGFDSSLFAYNNARSGSGSSYEGFDVQQPQPSIAFPSNTLFSEPPEYVSTESCYKPVAAMHPNPQDQIRFTGSLVMSPHESFPMRNDSEMTYSSQSSNEQKWFTKSAPSSQSSSGSVKIHGSPQYKCKHCGRSFTVERNKNRHEESSCPDLPDDQKKQHTCAECNNESKFSRSDGLTKHITDVHRKCTRCLDEHGTSQVFNSSDEIKKHKRDSHRVPIRNASGFQQNVRY